MTGVPETQSPEQPRSIRELAPKMRLQGTVKKTLLHGAVIDIGLEQDGLVHISQLAPNRVSRVADVVKEGDSVTVWVTKVPAESGSVALTMVEPAAVEWQELAEGQIRKGVVVRMEPYGVFVDIGAERAGLLHVREMSTGYVRHPSELVGMGDEVEVRVVKYDRRKRRIDLSMVGITPEVEEDADEGDEPAQTSMQIAYAQARDQRPGSSGSARTSRKVPAEVEERGAILARTLGQRPKR